MTQDVEMIMAKIYFFITQLTTKGDEKAYKVLVRKSTGIR